MNDKKTVIRVEMTNDDFEMLATASMHWAGQDWETQDGRFIPLPDRDTPIVWTYGYAFWFGPWANVILARSFLDAKGFAYQVLSDEGSAGECVIITDYAGNWEKEPK